MSALADAISRARPRSDLGDTSPFAGLHRRHARTVDVVAQSVAATAPAGVLLLHPAATYARSGSFGFFDIAVTITLVLGVALVVGMFARRIASTGSLYTFTARGLGTHAGLVAGVALGVGYLAVAMNTLSAAAVRVANLIVWEAPEPPSWVAPVLVSLFGCVIAAVIAHGLRISTRLLLVLEIVAVITVIGLSVAALSLTRWDLGLLVPDFGAFSLDAVVAGVAVALIGFVGFESGAALGPETRRPFAAVPRAIVLSVAATGFVLLVGTAAQLSIVAEQPGAASLAEVTGAAGLIDAIVAVSFLACALAMTNAATRLAFAMSREGLLPPMFGVVSPRGVPARGGIVLAALVTAVPLAVLALGGTREAMRAVTSPASVVGFILAYALLCAAAPVFLARIGELTAPAAVLAALPLIGLTTVLAVYLSSTSPEAAPGLLGALACLAALVVVGAVRLARHPLVASRVGLHDAPVDTDCIDGSGRA